jgi:hypothetical protein
MDKFDSTPPSLSLSPAPVSEPQSARRLVVLVPDLEWDYMPAIHRIWELGAAQPAHVLLLSLCQDPQQELSLRRALVILCALLQDGRIPVETNVEIATNWVDVVKRNYQTGDIIVCFAEQQAGFLQKPLSQILESNLTIPVYVVSGVHIPKPKSNWLAGVTAWLGSIGVIAGFGLLQIKIMQVSEGWFQTLLLILVVIVEIWLVWVWDSQFG